MHSKKERCGLGIHRLIELIMDYVFTCDDTWLFFSLSSPHVISFLVRSGSLFKIIILKRESLDIINSNVLLGVCAMFLPSGLFDYIYAFIIKQAKSVTISVKSLVRFSNSPMNICGWGLLRTTNFQTHLIH